MDTQQARKIGTKSGTATQAPDQVKELLKRLGAETGLACEIDAPADPAGEWWLDLKIDGFTTQVAWRPASGFGLFDADAGYGDRPSELYRHAEQASIRLAQLAAKHRANEATGGLSLREIRQLVGEQQVRLAERMNTDQAAISRVERRDDFKVSTLRSYVEALGGHVRILVDFESFEAPVEFGSAVLAPSQRIAEPA